MPRLMEETRVSVKDKSTEAVRGKMTNVSIRPVTGGFVVTKTYESRRAKQDWMNYENEEFVFSTKESMDQFVDRCFKIKD